MPLNIRLAGVRRLAREAKELSDATNEYHAEPLDKNIFEWHFTIRGPPSTPYENGIYHGRIIFPTDYPIKPPEIIFLTPNGRFQINSKICLSVSNHHPELWQPSWGVRTILIAIIGFFPTPPEGAIGAAEATEVEKIRLAAASQHWKCSVCKKYNHEWLADANIVESTSVTAEFQSLRSQLIFSPQEPEGKTVESPPKNNTSENGRQPVIQNQRLPYPWSDRMRVPVDVAYVRRLRPSQDLNFSANSESVLELSLPFYDWDLEERDDSQLIRTAASTNSENNRTSGFIPNTRIKIEQAFSVSYHVASLLTLTLLCLLIYTLGKRVLLIFILFLNALVD